MRQVSDQNVGSTIRPITNSALILLNVAVFLVEASLPPQQLAAFIQQWGATPATLAHFQSLPTLLTAMFLHGSWLHLLGNMAFLKLFGDNIEDAMGHWAYLGFYLLCGLAAVVAQIAIDPASTIPIVGASGAIAGVMGAYLVLFPTGVISVAWGSGLARRVVSVPAWVLIVVWFGQQFFNGVASLSASASTSGGIAFWAHVGGFVAGAALVWLFKDQAAVERQRQAQAAQHAAASARSGPPRGRPEGPANPKRPGPG